MKLLFRRKTKILNFLQKKKWIFINYPCKKKANNDNSIFKWWKGIKRGWLKTSLQHFLQFVKTQKPGAWSIDTQLRFIRYRSDKVWFIRKYKKQEKKKRWVD